MILKIGKNLKIMKKQYFHQNKDRINEYRKQYEVNRYKTDIYFRLIRITRSRVYKALKGKLKSSSTKEILGMDIGTYKHWI